MHRSILHKQMLQAITIIRVLYYMFTYIIHYYYITLEGILNVFASHLLVCISLTSLLASLPILLEMPEVEEVQQESSQGL